jgi:hypothetical protein
MSLTLSLYRRLDVSNRRDGVNLQRTFIRPRWNHLGTEAEPDRMPSGGTVSDKVNGK